MILIGAGRVEWGFRRPSVWELWKGDATDAPLPPNNQPSFQAGPHILSINSVQFPRRGSPVLMPFLVKELRPCDLLAFPCLSPVLMGKQTSPWDWGVSTRVVGN